MTDYKDRVSGWATDIDWSKAPEGFPIWIESPGGMAGSGWHRDDGDRWVDLSGSYWPKGADERGNCRVHLAPWTGECLPPVGTVCEARIPHHTASGVQMLWCEVEILAHAIVQGVEYSWVKELGADGGFYAPMMLSFRPIKTISQIAADERETAIGRMKECFDSVSDDLCPTSNKYLETLFGALHDAGYRLTAGDDK